jgi:hypothetical protein
MPFLGKGLWTIPPHVILNRKFIQSTKKTGINAVKRVKRIENNPEERTSYNNTQTILQAFKEETIKEAKKFAKKPVSPQEQMSKELDLKVRIISNDPTLSPNEKTDQVLALEKEAKIIATDNALAKKLATTAKCRLIGETMGKYWMNSAKLQVPKEVMTKLCKLL